jgi:chromosome-anchoring protein RacA
MKVLKTKEAAQELGVSQTTIKRWVSFFHLSFRKDRFGHYVFSDEDITKLQHIKEQIEQGMNMSQIDLPPLDSAQEASASSEQPGLDADELLARIKQLEQRLAQKADDVVSFQVLQHRKELEEIRKSVEQLAATVEDLRKTQPKPSLLHAEPKAADQPQKLPRKRSLIGSLFHF